MAAPVTGGGALAEDSAPAEDQRDKAEGWGEQYSALWVVEPPGGTVTTPAYNDGKKRCLSAEVGSGKPNNKVSEKHKTFTRAYRKSGRRNSVSEIHSEAQKRQKEMHEAARAAEMTEEEVALGKLKGLAKKQKRARLQRGKQARPSAYLKKPRARLQRGKQARTSAQRKITSAGLLRGRRARTSTQRKKPRAGLQRARRARIHAHR
jgi:hypothetical protein